MHCITSWCIYSYFDELSYIRVNSSTHMTLTLLVGQLPFPWPNTNAWQLLSRETISIECPVYYYTEEFLCMNVLTLNIQYCKLDLVKTLSIVSTGYICGK